MRRWAALVVVPVVATVAVIARRVDRLENASDAGVFVGMVRNLRSSLSLTSATDQYWIRLSPAATIERLGRIPVPDFGPAYSTIVALVPAPLDVGFVVVHCAALFVAVTSLGYLAWRATASILMAVAAQIIALWGPHAPGLFMIHGRPLDVYARFLLAVLVVSGTANLIRVVVRRGPVDRLQRALAVGAGDGQSHRGARVRGLGRTTPAYIAPTDAGG